MIACGGKFRCFVQQYQKQAKVCSIWFELKQRETIYNTVDHFEEIPMVESELPCDISAQSDISKNESYQVYNGNTNVNNNNNYGPQIEQSTESAMHMDPKPYMVTKTNDVTNEGEKTVKEAKSKMENGRSNKNLKKDFNHREMGPHTTYGNTAYCGYGGYMTPYPRNSKGPIHSDYPYFPPLNDPTQPRKSATMPQRSQSETWTPPSRYAGYEYHLSRNAAYTNNESMRRYPYNPGFRYGNQEQYRTSTNPLIAAYQQQNMDIPKGHIQVIYCEQI